MLTLAFISTIPELVCLRCRMSLLSDFAENTGIFKPAENLIDKVAFEALAEKYGPDVARGYLMAMLEVTQTLDGIVYDYKWGTGVKAVKSVINVKLLNLHKAMFNFLNPEFVNLKHLNKPITHRSRIQNF